MAIIWAGINPNDYTSGIRSNWETDNVLPKFGDVASFMYFRENTSGGAVHLRKDGLPDLTEFWIGAYFSRSTTNTAAVAKRALGCFDTGRGTTPILSCTSKAGTNHKMFFQRWNGSSTVDFAELTTAASTLYRLDIHVKIHPTEGRFAAYSNNTLLGEFNGNTAVSGAFTGIDRLEISRLLGGNTTGAGTASCWSGLFISDEDTRGVLPAERRTNGAGALQEWTGAAGNVVAAIPPPTTFITVTDPDKTATYTKPNLTAGWASRNFLGAIVSVVAQESSAGAAPVTPVLRLSDGTVLEGPQVSPGTALAPVQLSLPDNGGSPWSFADLNTAQIGIRSKTPIG